MHALLSSHAKHACFSAFAYYLHHRRRHAAIKTRLPTTIIQPRKHADNVACREARSLDVTTPRRDDVAAQRSQRTGGSEVRRA